MLFFITLFITNNEHIVNVNKHGCRENLNVNNLVQTIVPYPAFPERINSVLTATNQAQSCLLLRLKSRNASGAFHHLSFIGNFLILVDFGVRDAILLGGASSGQTSIKCCDLACDAEPPPSIN